MSDCVLTCGDLHAIFGAVALDLQGHLDELRELDAALGDGDLGVTMQLACGAMAGAAEQEQDDDVGTLLAALGMTINRVCPSTFGTLLASAFLGSGAAVQGKSAVGLKDLACMGAAAVEGIGRRGKAEVGDKTMLDALVPAVDAFRDELDGDASPAQAFAAAVKASERGVQATVGMIARYGRASWRGEDSVGVRDAGATALHYLIESFARHAADHLGLCED